MLFLVCLYSKIKYSPKLFLIVKKSKTGKQTKISANILLLEYVVHPHDPLAFRTITPKREAEYLCSHPTAFCTSPPAQPRQKTAAFEIGRVTGLGYP